MYTGHSSDDRQFIRRRMSSWPLVLAAGIAFLWMTSATAQSYTTYVVPFFVYNDGNIATPYRTSLDGAWADVQADLDYCIQSGCFSVQNLHPVTTGPYAIQTNGIWYWQYFDVEV